MIRRAIVLIAIVFWSTLSLAGWLPLAGVGGVSFNAQATAFFARLATQPNTARKTRYNTFFASLVAAGFYPSGVPICDAIYPFQSRDQATALTNMISSNFTATVVGSPIFATDGGIIGDNSGTTAIDTHMNPSTAVSANYVQNSAMLGAWSITPNAIHGATVGYVTNAYAEIRPRDTVANAQTGAINSTTQSAAVTSSDGSGLLAVDRSNSANFITYAQGVAGATTISVSTALANADINFLARASGSQPYTFGGIAFGAICGHLTAAQHTVLYNAIVAYRTGIASDYPTITRIVGTRNDPPTINTTVPIATANTFNQRRMTYLNAPCSNPRAVYTGWGYSIGDANLGNAYTVHTEIEAPSGTFTNLTSSGGNTMTVNPGDIADMTDAAPGVTIPAGQVWIRSFVTIASGVMYQNDYAPNSAVGDLAQQGLGLTDVAGGGTITTNMSFMLSSMLACDVPTSQRTVVLMTDSNGQGVGGYTQVVDGNGSGGGIGYLAGYLDTVMSNIITPKSIGGYIHNGRTGYAAASFASSPGNSRLQFAGALNVTDFWDQLGANDTNTGGSEITAATNLGIVNNDYVRATAGGIANVWQSTMVPQVSLSSTPPSDGNQTDLSLGKIAALNVIIRAGTIVNQTGSIEVGTTVDNTTIPNVNFWKTDGAPAGTIGATHDGKHLYCVNPPCNVANAPGPNAVVTALIAANALSP
jgi:hypothetical protein